MNLDNALYYADDTKLFMVIRSMMDRNILQASIRNLQNWAIENGLTLNPSKTYQVSYGKRVINICYFLKGTEISKVNQVRAANFGIKILKNELKTSIYNEIEPFIIRREQTVRFPNLFYTFNNVPNKSPVYIIIKSMQYYQRYHKCIYINLNLSILTKKTHN